MALADVLNLLHTIRLYVTNPSQAKYMFELSLEIGVFIFATASFKTITQLWTNKRTNMTHNLYKLKICQRQKSEEKKSKPSEQNCNEHTHESSMKPK